MKIELNAAQRVLAATREERKVLTQAIKDYNKRVGAIQDRISKIDDLYADYAAKVDLPRRKPLVTEKKQLMKEWAELDRNLKKVADAAGESVEPYLQ